MFGFNYTAERRDFACCWVVFELDLASGECNKLGFSVNLNGNFDLDVEVVIWVCLIDSNFDWQTCFFEGKKESLFVLCNYFY